MAEVLPLLEVALGIIDLGFKIYEIIKDVREGFQKQSGSLQNLMREMHGPLDVLCQQLANYSDDPKKVDPAGVRPILEEINYVFTLIYNLIERVSKKKVKLSKWKAYNRDFECFQKLLLGLRKRLNDAIMAHMYLKSNEMIEALANLDKKFGDGFSVIQEQQQNAKEDFENFLREQTNEIEGAIEAAAEDVKKAVEEGFQGAHHEREDMMNSITRRLSMCVISSGGIEVPTVSPKDLSEQEELCKGTYGKIWKAKLDYENVLVKDITDVSNVDVIENFLAESKNLMKFTSDYIVRLMGICNLPDRKFLVLEYMERGDLSHVLHVDNEELKSKLRLRMALCASKAVYRLHVKKMLHECIKSEKFLVSKSYSVKLADLRFAKSLSSVKRYKPTKKPPVDGYHYVCPEQRVGAVQDSEATEIYSFGIVLWEVLSRSKPFSTIGSDPSEEDVDDFLEKKKVEKLPSGLFPPDVTRELEKLLQDCRSDDPSHRPKAIKILSKLDELICLF